MKRRALQDMIKWKNNPTRKPLLLHGARQVGKTWLMEEFGRTCFTHVIYINFERNLHMRDLFGRGELDPQQLIQGIETEFNTKITAPDTLLIFDEIQAAPLAITSLKYFYEETPQYHIIGAGSLLGVALHEGVSYPVGKVDSMTLYPLSFYEFLDALGETQLHELLVRQQWKLLAVFKEKLLTYLKEYMIVGGMPEVVAAFVAHRDFQKVRKLQKQILDAYEKDFSKHVPKDVLPKVQAVWHSISSQLSKENKKFQYSLIEANSRAKQFEDAIEWLLNSGLIYKVTKVTKPALPLIGYTHASIFKLFMLDIGLLSAMSGLKIQILLEGDKLFTEFKGALTEQYVLQELMGLQDITIMYWGNDTGLAEVDFLVQYDGQIIPIEVKASVNLRAKSLKTYIDKYHPTVALRTSQADYKQTDSLYDIPLFMISNFPQVTA